MPAIDIDTIVNVFLGVLMASTAYTIGFTVIKTGWDVVTKKLKKNSADTKDTETLPV